MKILSLSNVPMEPYLGSGKTRLAWTNGLRKLGHQVTVLQPVDFIFMPKFNKAKKFRIAIGVFLKVKNLLKKEDFDLIEFYGDEYWLLLLWLKKIKRKAPLLTAHADGIELLDFEKEQQFWNKRTGFKRIYFFNTHYRLSMLTFKLADKFVCGCSDDLQYVIDRKIFKTEDAVYVSPGIDDFFQTLPFIKVKNNVIIFLGSWIGRKGTRIIPFVLESVLTLLPQFEFHVYGAWHNKSEILSKFSPQIADRVKVFDKVLLEEVINALKVSKIFFFPTYSEGFGLATAEALSCSTAVVTTKTGLGSELKNEENALICEFDDVEGMKNALLKLASNEVLRNRICKNGYEFVKRYHWETQVNLLNNYYSKWVADLPVVRVGK